MRHTPYANSLNRLQSLRRTAMLGATHWDSVRPPVPGPAEAPRPGGEADPDQLEFPIPDPRPLPS